MNHTAVTEEVNRIKNSPALLLWYTGDEPDGTSDPLNATTATYDLINSLDGYHPVSLVLNCENYFWPEYTAGSDIVMQDTYMIGINATYSVVWVRARHLLFPFVSCSRLRRTLLAPRAMATVAVTTAAASLKILVRGWTSLRSVALLKDGSAPRLSGLSHRVSVETRAYKYGSMREHR